MADAFRKFAHATSRLTGSFEAFMLALLLVVVWALSGPLFGFASTWQLVINTATTIVTFLMVFLIQNTQNRDSQAIHAKLDEILSKERGTDNKLLMAEDLSDEELAELKAHYERLAGPLAAKSRGSAARQDQPSGSKRTRRSRSRPRQNGRAPTKKPR